MFPILPPKNNGFRGSSTMCPTIFLLKTKGCLHSKPHVSPKKQCVFTMFSILPLQRAWLFTSKKQCFSRRFSTFFPCPPYRGEPPAQPRCLGPALAPGGRVQRHPQPVAAAREATGARGTAPAPTLEAAPERWKKPWGVRWLIAMVNMFCLSYTYYKCCLCLGVHFHLRPGATQLHPGTQSPDLHVDYIIYIYIDLSLSLSSGFVYGDS